MQQRISMYLVQTEKENIRFVFWIKKDLSKCREMMEKLFFVKREATGMWSLRCGKIYQQDAILRPDYYICAGARVMDFSGSVDLDKIMMLMEVEMQMINPSDDVIIVGAKNSL